MLVNKLEYHNTADTISSAAPGHVAPASPGLGLGLGLFYLADLHWRIHGALYRKLKENAFLFGQFTIIY